MSVEVPVSSVMSRDASTTGASIMDAGFWRIFLILIFCNPNVEEWCISGYSGFLYHDAQRETKEILHDKCLTGSYGEHQLGCMMKPRQPTPPGLGMQP